MTDPDEYFPAEIVGYGQLHALAEGTVVHDAAGNVWCVKKYRYREEAPETWLCPFSDEYAFTVKADGSTDALGNQPKLPITVTNLTSRSAG